MLIICGKTASGKDTIVRRLVSDYKFKRIITYTSRPMRNGEIQNKSYHFITENDFKDKINNNFFAEWKIYHTVSGNWYYGTALKDLENADENSVIILTPDGIRDILELLDKKPKCIYINSPDEVIEERLLLRGDDEREAKRRLQHDSEDFMNIEKLVDQEFLNLNNTNIRDICENIVMWLSLNK